MKMSRVIGVLALSVIVFLSLHVHVLSQQLLSVREVFNKVWDKANSRLMTTPWAGAQQPFETETTILNNVYDSANLMLRVSGGGAGSGDVSSNTASSVDSEMVLFSGTGGKTVKRGVGTGYVFVTDGVVSTVAGVEGFLLDGQSQQTGTAYTVLASDESKMILFLNSSPIAVTLPDTEDVGFGEGATFMFRNIGTGLVTVTPVGATINGSSSMTIRPQEMATILSDGVSYAAFRAIANPMTGIGDMLYGGANGAVTRLAAASGFVRANGAAAPTITTLTRGLVFSVGDPGGDALVAGATVTSYATVPFACTLTAWNLLVDAGTVTVKFWKVATGIAIPTSSNSINTNGVSIATGTAVHSATMTDFTTVAVAKDDIVAMNVTAVATAKYVSATLQCEQ